MSPEQFLAVAARGTLKPVYLFLGPEIYKRRLCREAAVNAVLPDVEERENGLTRLELDDVSLAEVIDDARAMSLFAGQRLIWVGSAEGALPRGRGASVSEEDEGKSEKAKGSDALLAAYAKDPTPGVTLVFDCSRYDFDGEDKTKVERVAKFYAACEVVEFRKANASDAKTFAHRRAKELKLDIAPADLERLVEATAADLARLDNEIEKLSLYAEGGKIDAAAIAALVPNLSETTVFALVNALAKRDRIESLRLLDTLIREGEYLPLALTFLAGLLRMALAAREQNLRSAQDVQNYFQRRGVPMWRSRAEQVHMASLKFPKDKLESAIALVFRADRDMKGARPDDRLVMEDFVLRLTEA